MSDPTYQCLKNAQSKRIRSPKNRLSIEGTKTILAATKHTFDSHYTEDVLKKANSATLLNAADHCLGFLKLCPYLETFEKDNPGFKYDLKTNQETLEFEKLALLLPYTLCVLDDCYKVYGVDTAFLDSYYITDREKILLIQEYLPNAPIEKDLMFKPTYITAVSGRTLNNEMIIFSVCFSYSESIETYSFLFEFLSREGVIIS